MCHEHPTMRLDAFCKKCQVLICWDCISDEGMHLGHAPVSKPRAANEMKRHLDSKVSELDSDLEQLQSLQKASEHSIYQRIRDGALRLMDQLNSLAEACTRQMDKQGGEEAKRRILDTTDIRAEVWSGLMMLLFIYLHLILVCFNLMSIDMRGLAWFGLTWLGFV